MSSKSLSNPTPKSIPPDHDPFNTKKRTVYEIKGWRLIVFWPIAILLHLWFRSWRLEMDETSRQLLRDTPAPRILVVWHNRSLVMPEVLRTFFQPNNIDCLISASKAAAWESAIFKTYHLNSIRGSSTRRSIQAVREMINAIKENRDICLSPDGPSGPLYQVKKGGFAIAAKTKIPLLFISTNAPFSFRLKTWDKHLIPLPFAKLTVKLRRDDLAKRPLESESDYQKIAQDYLEITEDPFQFNP